MNSQVPTKAATPTEAKQSETVSSLTYAEAKDAVQRNCNSLRTILEDIVSKLSYQVLGNAEILENLKIDSELVAPGKGSEVAAFRKGEVELLIHNPIKLVLGRLNGLKKVIDKIREQLDQLTPDEKVSTGNAIVESAPGS